MMGWFGGNFLFIQTDSIGTVDFLGHLPVTKNLKSFGCGILKWHSSRYQRFMSFVDDRKLIPGGWLF
jgi:hypothetical protein